MFESASKDVHFAGALAGPDTEWTAGGFGVVASGSGKTSEERPLPGLTLERFGVGPDGATYAVGSHGTVWKRKAGNDWVIEHQSRPPGTKGKRRSDDLLVGIRVVPYQSQMVLLAHGPFGTPSLIRDEKGTWTPIDDPEVAKRLSMLAILGPSLELPKGCTVDRWRWIDNRDGVAVCSDGRAFAYLGGSLTAFGKAPKVCESMRTVARRGDEIFAGCGSDGRVMRLAPDGWRAVPGVKNIFALAANERCLIAASKRAVFRQCVQAEKRLQRGPDAGAAPR